MKVRVTEKFRIRTQKGEIELVPGQVIDLKEEKADVLLKTGRVVSMIPEDLTGALRGLFEKAANETAASYLPGTLEMIRTDFPDLANEIDQAETKSTFYGYRPGKGPAN